MEEFFSKPWVQGLGLLLVAGLLAIPYVGKLIRITFPGLLPEGDHKKNPSDFTKQTVLELMTLKTNLEKEGPPQAAKMCKDLIVALVSGDPAAK